MWDFRLGTCETNQSYNFLMLNQIENKAQNNGKLNITSLNKSYNISIIRNRMKYLIFI